MVTLSSEAAAAMQDALLRAGKPDAGLRIMIEPEGCSGLKYSIGLAQDPAPDDVVIESSGVRLFIDPISQTFASGLRVDLVNREGHMGLVFEGLSAASGCACGRRGSGCGIRP